MFQFPRAVFLKSAPDTAKLFKKFWVFVYLKKLYPMVIVRMCVGGFVFEL